MITTTEGVTLDTNTPDAPRPDWAEVTRWNDTQAGAPRGVTVGAIERADAELMEYETCERHGITTDSFHSCGECTEERDMARFLAAERDAASPF
jgi:hypothetical protein